jgi:hypothetical protein
MPKVSSVEESIKYCIKKNGFPEKNVRLPFKAIHESCKKHDIALKEVLSNLNQHKIVGIILGDFIEFRSGDTPQQKTKVPKKESRQFNTNIPDIENLKELAQSYMTKMSPEQIKELEKTVLDMTEDEKENILKNFSQQFIKKNP